ncbi:MAG: preprotein translocase subunit SecY [Candidatus Heimdallarchaeota archaeon]|nr:preprotein translocase subunit SecY [Candidatus Heimdallarchaeota archaeon]MCG3257974.1 preprotein translocase subunit SecY [Candidatus Heimdallarchaeota archaeon]MCK4613025.1 preprotein translocase subunit SecY [Candidatus Heimdallarchaeota archaeon]
MASKFLLLFKPFQRFTLEVKKPARKPSFKRKIAWTFGILSLYLVMLNIPLVGVPSDEGTDPFFAMRAILASQRGSLAELGIGPIVTAGLIMQLLVGSQIIKVDFSNPEERALYTGTQKILAILMTVFEALAYILGGAYGEDIGFEASILILVQLLVAGFIILLMDEIIQKGYGLGSGISLFIAASVSFNIFDGMFSLSPEPSGGFNWYRGCVLAFFQAIFSDDPNATLSTPFSRVGRTPDLIGLLATIVVFAVVIYVDSIKIEIPVQHSQYKMPARYPIKFLYTSNIPVILVSALFANIYFISNLMWNNWKSAASGLKYFLVRFFGTWEDISGGTGSQQLAPVTGLASYTTAPYGPEQIAQYPVNAIIYLVLMIALCGIFSRIWIDTAGMSSKNVAKQLLDANMQIPGFRRNPRIVERYLERYIPTAAWLGGFFIGVLAAFADFLGALGTGTGILLTTGILRQYYEIFASEQVSETVPALAGFLGLK